MTIADKERLEELETKYKLVYKGTGEIIGKSYPGGAPITDDDRYEWTGTEEGRKAGMQGTLFRYEDLKYIDSLDPREKVWAVIMLLHKFREETGVDPFEPTRPVTDDKPDWKSYLYIVPKYLTNK